MPLIRVAAAHAAPVFLDLPATLDKTCSLIREAARRGARLIAFPETFIPAFPVWSALRAPIYNHDLFCRLVAGSILADGPEMARVCQTARASDIVVALGFNERVESSVGTLYNSNVLIGTDGTVLNHHRKLVPTFYEKLTWSPGDGAGLRVCDTPCGRVGMLICGENTNPLARYTLMAQAEQVHIANYPPVWPTHGPEQATYDLPYAIRIRAGTHSLEAKAFTIVSSGYMDKPMFEFLAALSPDAKAILEASPRGISVMTGPGGAVISDELRDDEGILYGEIDADRCVEPKQIHDISGGYNRFDVFHLTVNRAANRPIRFTCDGEWESSMNGTPDGVKEEVLA